MSEETGAIPGGEVVSYPVADDTPMTVEDAARDLSAAREKALNPTAESAEQATAEIESTSQEDDAALVEEAHGEDEEADPVAEPLIERPKSWTESEEAEWRSTPRALQQKIAARELERDTALRRTQNEAAEKLKGLTAKEQQAEQARQQYEAKLTSTVKIMEDALQAEFGDIQSLTDVRKLQAEDPFRFQAWQVRQMELTAAKSEQVAAEQRQSQEKQSKRNAYEVEQNALLIELVPEMADPKKANDLRTRAVAMLVDDLGLKNDQLSRWMADDTGHEILSNAGIQKLIADGLKYREIKSAPKAVATQKVPPVQRPGASKPAGAGVTAQIQALEKQLSSATGDKAARISADIYRLEKRVKSA